MTSHQEKEVWVVDAADSGGKVTEAGSLGQAFLLVWPMAVPMRT